MGHISHRVVLLCGETKINLGKIILLENISNFDLLLINMYAKDGLFRVFGTSVVDVENFKKGLIAEPTTKLDYGRVRYVDENTIEILEITYGFIGFIYGIKL